MRTQKERLVRTWMVAGTIAIATVATVAGIIGGIECGVLTTVEGIIFAMPMMAIGGLSLALHCAADNRLHNK